jgi:hypothetical protein
VNLFRQTTRISSISFDIKNFLNFFKEFIRILNNSDTNMNESEIATVRALVHDNLLTLSQDVDYIAYLNGSIVEYLNVIDTIKGLFLTKKTYYSIISNIIELSPLVIFRKNLPAIGEKLFHFLLGPKYEQYTLPFFTRYIDIFMQSFPVLQKNTVLFQESTKLLQSIKDYITKQPASSLSAPVKKAISDLLKQWYLSGNLPENDFDIHKQIITMWVDYVGFQDKLQSMMNTLYIKDLAWACGNNNLNLVKQKYQELPDSVFSENKTELMDQLILVLHRNFTTPNEFNILLEIFTYFKQDYRRFELTPRLCKI